MKKTETTKKSQFRPCACYACEMVVSGKASFRQGHDARLISVIANRTVGLPVASVVDDDAWYLALADDVRGDMQARIDALVAEMERRHGSKLAAKLDNACMNAWVKEGRKSREGLAVAIAEDIETGEEEERDPQPGWVKVGRWLYAARRFATGEVLYDTRSGDSVWANEKQAATFKEN